jgi:hypothetical protein
MMRHAHPLTKAGIGGGGKVSVVHRTPEHRTVVPVFGVVYTVSYSLLANEEGLPGLLHSEIMAWPPAGTFLTVLER